MKTKSTAWIIFILTSLLTTNCTIEKRLFQPGYNIQWKKKIPQRDAAENVNRVSDSRNTSNSIISDSSLSDLILAPKNFNPETLTTDKLPESIVESTKSIEQLDTIFSNQVTHTKIATAPAQKKAVDLVETEEKKELELFGVMSFGLYFCSLIFAILAVFVFNLPAYLFVIAGFMILLSLIFGIISVDRYRRNKSKYYRNFFGYFGLIASVVTISLVIGFLILTSELGGF